MGISSRRYDRTEQRLSFPLSRESGLTLGQVSISIEHLPVTTFFSIKILLDFTFQLVL